MRFAAAPLALSLALLAVPALAQSSVNGVDNETNQHPSVSGNYSSNNNGSSADQQNRNLGATNRSEGRFAGNNNQPGLTYDTQQKIRQSLEQNGFRNVQVTPEAFVIRAQAPDGSRVLMEVTPDQFAEAVQPNTSTRSSHSGQMNSNSSGSSSNDNWKSGGDNNDMNR